MSVAEQVGEMVARLERERDEAVSRAELAERRNGDLCDELHELRQRIKELETGMAA